MMKKVFMVGGTLFAVIVAINLIVGPAPKLHTKPAQGGAEL
jgi:hypothetical protein